jgi:hypothetical protein
MFDQTKSQMMSRFQMSNLPSHQIQTPFHRKVPVLVQEPEWELLLSLLSLVKGVLRMWLLGHALLEGNLAQECCLAR